jgi:hypothetical protein
MKDKSKTHFFADDDRVVDSDISHSLRRLLRSIASGSVIELRPRSSSEQEQGSSRWPASSGCRCSCTRG